MATALNLETNVELESWQRAPHSLASLPVDLQCSSTVQKVTKRYGKPFPLAVSPLCVLGSWWYCVSCQAIQDACRHDPGQARELALPRNLYTTSTKFHFGDTKSIKVSAMATQTISSTNVSKEQLNSRHRLITNRTRSVVQYSTLIDACSFQAQVRICILFGTLRARPPASTRRIPT